jgi:hypothetical protein
MKTKAPAPHALLQGRRTLPLLAELETLRPGERA